MFYKISERSEEAGVNETRVHFIAAYYYYLYIFGWRPKFGTTGNLLCSHISVLKHATNVLFIVDWTDFKFRNCSA